MPGSGSDRAPAALLWDVDGTLAETELQGHRLAFNRAFAGAGLSWHWDLDTYRSLLAISGGQERMRHYAITVAGEDVAGVAPHLLRRRIGYVFQETGLFPHLTVAENIAITPRLLGWDIERMARRVIELLSLVALPADVSGRAPSELSGGQRQRVGLARALAAEPTLMLMDEPFGALDPLTRDSLGIDYHTLHDRLGLTTIMVTHDIAEAVLLADRVVVLAAGRILADGTPAHLLATTSDPTVRALLEAPKHQAERLRERLGA